LDSEQHLLFECAAVEDVRTLFWGKLGLMDEIYRILGAIFRSAAQGPG
jgi:hypothetical protein